MKIRVWRCAERLVHLPDATLKAIVSTLDKLEARAEVEWIRKENMAMLLKLQTSWDNSATFILSPRDHIPFGQHQESQPLDRSSEIPVLNGFLNTIDLDQNQSDLPDLTGRDVRE